MRRRRLLHAAVAIPAIARTGRAQPAFPERSIRIVVPYAAGGATDVAARVLAEALTATLPQPVVENRSGAASMVGTEAVARAAADGHTLLLNNTAHAALRVVVPNANLDPHRALLPVTVFSDLRMNEIPYRGGAPATLDLAAGRIAMVFDAAVTGLQTARGGQARAFAVTGPRRSPTAPEVPTWREIGVDAEMQLWQALFVPAATPAPVRAALHAAVARVQADPTLGRRWAELGVDRAMALPPAESEAYVGAEVARWERVMAGSRDAAEPPAR